MLELKRGNVYCSESYGLVQFVGVEPGIDGDCEYFYFMKIAGRSMVKLTEKVLLAQIKLDFCVVGEMNEKEISS